MANLLEENMFTNYNSSILRQHTVKEYAFVFYRVSKDYHSNNFNNYLFLAYIQGGSNMTGTAAACLQTNQSRSYLNDLVLYYLQLS